MSRQIIVRSGKRTKIVCTIGPACRSIEVKRRLIQAGANVFRLNFSHGSHDDHADSIRQLRELGLEMGCPFAILADLAGPKIRLGRVANEPVAILEGERIVLTTEDAAEESGRYTVSFDGFHEVVRRGEPILIDDGKIRFTVERIDGRNVTCRADNNGMLRSRKGINLPDTRLPIPALTEKDHGDLRFALEAGADMIALSFVRRPSDVLQTRKLMHQCGRRIPVLAKIEMKEALTNLEAIIEVSDGAMVARGDLGIEIPMEQVPAAQKRIIALCNKGAKPVITATQMLESMMGNPRPTRAEVTDIYSAIQDGTDAIMLSGETAAGSYPVEAVEVMDTVAIEAERALDRWPQLEAIFGRDWKPTVSEAISESAIKLAHRLEVDLIIIPTVTGHSAFQAARFRPAVPVFACSPNVETVNRMCLAWGVEARLMEPLREDEVAKSETDALVKEAIRCAVSHGFARVGQRAIVLGGVPYGKPLNTNHLRIEDIE